MRFVIAAISGLVVGLVVPLPGGGDPAEVSAATELEWPTPQSDGVRCRPAADLEDERRRLFQEQEALATTRAAFLEDWGRPMQAPPEWDQVGDEARVRERIAALEVESVELDCTHYPCLVALAMETRPEAQDLAAWFGVDADTIGMASAEVEGETVWMPHFAFVSEQPTDPDERRWLDARLLQHQHQLRLPDPEVAPR